MLTSPVEHNLESLKPRAARSRVDLQLADATFCQRFPDGWQIHAELEHGHCSLHALGRNPRVFAVQLVLEPQCEALDLSLSGRRSRLCLEQIKCSLRLAPDIL